MRIIRDTPQHLIAEETSVFFAALMVIVPIGCWAIALNIDGEARVVLALFGFFWLLVSSFLVERLQLIFNVDTNTARIRSRTIWRYREDVLALENIREVQREESRDDEGSVTYRFVLIQKDGSRHPLSGTFTNIGRSDATAARMSTWLAERRKR